MDAPVPSLRRGAGRARLRPARHLLAFLPLGLLVALTVPATAFAGWWVPQRSGVKASLDDVEFVDSRTGWAVGTGGTIVATTNGGATWVEQVSGTTEYLLESDFVDRKTGWVVGYNGTILHTDDGGTTWVKQATDVPDLNKFNLYGVSFVDAMNGWACGYWGTLLRTTGGGTTWTRIVWPFGENVYISTLWHDIAMVDATHGWMVGDNLIAWPSVDPPWTATGVGSQSTHLTAVDSTSATSAWAVGYSGAAFSTSDGTTWVRQTLAPAAATSASSPRAPQADTHRAFLGVSCLSSQVLHIASQDQTVYSTTNGGTTWKAEQVPTRYLLADVDFPDAKHGWTVGSSGSIYTYSQTPFRPVARALANVTVTRRASAMLPYRVAAATLTCKATIKIARKGKTVKTMVIKGVQTNQDQVKGFVCTLPKGAYTWSIAAVDADGRSSLKSPSKKLTVR